LHRRAASSADAEIREKEIKMRSTVATLTLGAFLALAGATVALAKGASHEFSGRVDRVDGVARTLVVKGKGTPAEEMTFALAPDAKIMSGAMAEGLEALKPGDQVKVTYVTEGSERRAERIEVKSQKTAALPSDKPASRY
jgi:hypothetical protein